MLTIFQELNSLQVHKNKKKIVDCKTVRIFAYSSRLKTESETGERLRVRLLRLLRPALPISLLILRKKPTVLQSTVSAVVRKVASATTVQFSIVHARNSSRDSQAKLIIRSVVKWREFRGNKKIATTLIC